MMPWFVTLPFLHVIDFSIQEVYQAARFEKDTRYYVIRLEKDLFDYWTITIVGGRIKSKLGQSRTIAFPDFSDTFQHFCALSKQHQQRGYQVTSLSCHAPLFLIFILTLSTSAEICETQDETNVTAKPKRRSTTKNSSSAIQSLLASQPAHQQIGFSF